MGSIPGVILGVIALIALPEAFRQFEAYRMLIFGLTMILMMLFRPAGLIPAKRMGQRSEEKEG
jgi:branched-chain amino acid transport system permease protein